MKTFSKISFLAIISIIAFSCSQLQDVDPIDVPNESLELSEINPNARISALGVEPTLWTSGPGGNARCEDVGLELDHSTARNDFNNGNFESMWPEGFTIEVVDNKYVNWSYVGEGTKCLEAIAFIVKGGPASHIYVYEDGQTSDQGLVSPLVGKKKKKNADLSNLTICFSFKNCEVGGND